MDRTKERDGIYKWAEYYLSTEEHDRRVCVFRCPRSGVALPASDHERRLCSQFAHFEMKRLGLQGDTPGKEEAARYSLDGLRWLLGQEGQAVEVACPECGTSCAQRYGDIYQTGHRGGVCGGCWIDIQWIWRGPSEPAR